MDIAGSVAYAQASGKTGVLKPEEVTMIVDGLAKVRAEWAAGTFVLTASDEDIHTANERRLTELIGPVGGKVHEGYPQTILEQYCRPNWFWLAQQS